MLYVYLSIFAWVSDGLKIIISFLFFFSIFHSPSPMLCLALVKSCYLKDISVHCVFPESIHISLIEGHWKF